MTPTFSIVSQFLNLLIYYTVQNKQIWTDRCSRPDSWYTLNPLPTPHPKHTGKARFTPVMIAQHLYNGSTNRKKKILQKGKETYYFHSFPTSTWISNDDGQYHSVIYFWEILSIRRARNLQWCPPHVSQILLKLSIVLLSVRFIIN